MGSSGSAPPDPMVGGTLVGGLSDQAVGDARDAQLRAIAEAETRAKTGATNAQGILNDLVQQGLVRYDELTGGAVEALNRNADVGARAIDRSLGSALNTVGQNSSLAQYFANTQSQNAINQVRIGAENARPEMKSATQQAIDTLSQQFGAAKNNFVPFQRSGLNALDEMTSLMGLPGRPSKLYDMAELDSNKPQVPRFNRNYPTTPTYPNEPKLPFNTPLVAPTPVDPNKFGPNPGDFPGFAPYSPSIQHPGDFRFEDARPPSEKTQERKWNQLSQSEAASRYGSNQSEANKWANGFWTTEERDNPDYGNYMHDYESRKQSAQAKYAVDVHNYNQFVNSERQGYAIREHLEREAWKNRQAEWNQYQSQIPQLAEQYHLDNEAYKGQVAARNILEAQQKQSWLEEMQNYTAQREQISGRYNNEVGDYNQELSQYNTDTSLYPGRIENYNTQRATLSDEATTSALSPQQIQEKLASTPGYQFQLQEGLKQVENSASRKGLLYSGALLKDLVQYSQGLANQTYGQRLSQLADLVGQGFQASTIKSQLESQYGTSVADLQTQLGNNLANLDVDRASKESALTSNLANLLIPIITNEGQSKAGLYTQRGNSLANLYSQLGSNVANLYGTQGANVLQALMQQGMKSADIQTSLGDALQQAALASGQARSTAYTSPLSAQTYKYAGQKKLSEYMAMQGGGAGGSSGGGAKNAMGSAGMGMLSAGMAGGPLGGLLTAGGSLLGLGSMF